MLTHGVVDARPELPADDVALGFALRVCRTARDERDDLQSGHWSGGGKCESESESEVNVRRGMCSERRDRRQSEYDSGANVRGGMEDAKLERDVKGGLIFGADLFVCVGRSDG